MIVYLSQTRRLVSRSCLSFINDPETGFEVLYRSSGVPDSHPCSDLPVGSSRRPVPASVCPVGSPESLSWLRFAQSEVPDKLSPLRFASSEAPKVCPGFGLPHRKFPTTIPTPACPSEVPDSHLHSGSSFREPNKGSTVMTKHETILNCTSNC